MIRSVSKFIAGFVICMSPVLPVAGGTFTIDMIESNAQLSPGLSTRVWSYNGTVPGTTIRAAPGERIIIEGTNKLPVSTNIHWHGIPVPNDQDGPGREIKPGQKFRYEFVVPESGTYWYHSHFSPVLDQMDMGLYGTLIVSAPEDSGYSGDHTLVLDDWYLDARGRRLSGTDRGDMERYGNIETVNGKTAEAIPSLELKSGELHKLRFVNASTAAVHTLSIGGHRFRVTHVDGHALTEPYFTDKITLNPAERIDAELEASGRAGEKFEIRSDRPDLGIIIPIRYRSGTAPKVVSRFTPPKSRAFPGIDGRNPDITLTLNSVMPGMATGGAMDHSAMGHGSMNHGMASSTMGLMGNMMRWTIDGASWPDTKPLNVKLNTVVKMRFYNKDTDMGHPMDHPMHLHGTSFQVVSVNGTKPAREMWKDTVNVPAGGYVDIAFVFTNPGDWMLHCHVIDHEDNGLMTMIRVR